MSEPELPALYHAAVANDLGEVERLLTAGAEPNDGESIFHAAEKNHRAVIDLHWAAWTGHVAAVRTLVSTPRVAQCLTRSLV